MVVRLGLLSRIPVIIVLIIVVIMVIVTGLHHLLAVIVTGSLELRLVWLVRLLFDFRSTDERCHAGPEPAATSIREKARLATATIVYILIGINTVVKLLLLH